MPTQTTFPRLDNASHPLPGSSKLQTDRQALLIQWLQQPQPIPWPLWSPSNLEDQSDLLDREFLARQWTREPQSPPLNPAALARLLNL